MFEGRDYSKIFDTMPVAGLPLDPLMLIAKINSLSPPEKKHRGSSVFSIR